MKKFIITKYCGIIIWGRIEDSRFEISFHTADKKMGAYISLKDCEQAIYFNDIYNSLVEDCKKNINNLVDGTTRLHKI